MNNNLINISFMNEKILDTLYSNPKRINEYIKQNPYDSKWLKELFHELPFEQRKQKIIDFELKLSSDGNYKNVEVENAISLYEHIKDLPRYILVDNRFWLWLEFGKFYRVALQAMPLTTDTRLEYSWLFKEGKRGIWRNTFARGYFWVEFTVDETRNDRYELTKFVFEKTERIQLELKKIYMISTFQIQIIKKLWKTVKKVLGHIIFILLLEKHYHYMVLQEYWILWMKMIYIVLYMKS